MKLLKSLIENPDTTFVKRARNIGFGFTVCLAWVIIVRLIYGGLQLDGQQLPFPFFKPQPPQYIMILREVFFAIILAPLWEELAFRVGPLRFAKGIAKATGDNGVLLGAMLMCSAIFGLAHHNGAYSILVQGVMGFIFAMVYIKNGFHYWSSVILHAFWNFMVAFGLPFFVN